MQSQDCLTCRLYVPAAPRTSSASRPSTRAPEWAPAPAPPTRGPAQTFSVRQGIVVSPQRRQNTSCKFFCGTSFWLRVAGRKNNEMVAMLEHQHEARTPDTSFCSCTSDVTTCPDVTGRFEANGLPKDDSGFTIMKTFSRTVTEPGRKSLCVSVGVSTSLKSVE